MLLFVVATAFAGPSFAVMGGGGVISGVADDGREYSSTSPVLAATVDWRFAWVEAWVGVSATGLVAPEGDGIIPAALLQGEVGLGLGNPVSSAGIFFGSGLSGGEGGVYGRLMFPGPGWASRLGGELRAFHLGATNSSGAAFLLRAELGELRRRSPPPLPPPPPVHHDDPYAD